MLSITNMTKALAVGLVLATATAFLAAGLGRAGLVGSSFHALMFLFAAPVLLAAVVQTASSAERQQFYRGRLSGICLGLGAVTALALTVTTLFASAWLRVSFVAAAAVGVMLIILLARLERANARAGGRGHLTAPGYREQLSDFEQDATGQLLFLAGAAFLILGALLAAHDGKPLLGSPTAGAAGLVAGWLGSWSFGLLAAMTGRLTGVAVQRPIVARYGAVGWIAGAAGFMASGSYYYLYLLVPSALAMLYPIARALWMTRARPKLVVVGSTRQTLSRPQFASLALCQVAALCGIAGIFVPGVGFAAAIVWPSMTAAVLWLQILAVSRRYPVQHWRAACGIGCWLLAPWLWLYEPRLALVAIGLGALLILFGVVPTLLQDRNERGPLAASMTSHSR